MDFNMKRKVILCFCVIVVLLSEVVTAFYSYENTFSIFQLKRNIFPANYTVSYDKTTLTNKDVEVKMEFDKVVSIVGENQNAVLSEDGKNVTKILEANENSKILIRDEDFNYQEVEYDVNWIDKKPPIITGAENGMIYNSDVHLDFTDESGITDIYVDSFNDSFSIYTREENFWQDNLYQMVPATRNSVTIYVMTNKKEMEKYNYYMDGKLYATTNRKEYTFRGLELSDVKHHFVVEALDRDGNVLETRETYRSTVPIDEIRFGNTGGVEYITIAGIPNTAYAVEAYTWVEGHFEETMQMPYIYYDNSTTCLIALEMQNHNNYTGKYIVYFLIKYLADDGTPKTFDCIGNIIMPSEYTPYYYYGVPYDFRNNGNYYVRCIDTAGNESELEFTVQK